MRWVLGAALDVRGGPTAWRFVCALGRRLRWRARLLRHGPSGFAAFAQAPVRRGRGGESPGPALPPRVAGLARLSAADRAAAGCAFPVRHWNPRGWVRNVERCPVKLDRHARALRTGAAGVLPAALRRCHHAADAGSFHDSPRERAAALVVLAASGVPVRLLDWNAELAGLVGAELYGLMRRDVRGLGVGARERYSVALRRAALRGHGTLNDGRPVRDAAPTVSVVLATCRPGRLAGAAAAVGGQNYPRLELVLALHGAGFASAEVEAAVAAAGVPTEVLRVPATATLGAVLDSASRAGRGTLLTKMDDDDVYGPDHVWDLVLARLYSGASVVGKGLETVYLARSARTVQRLLGTGERYGTHRHRADLGGMTLLLGRDDLAALGGWPDLPSSVDAALVDAVLAAGGTSYRTHGQGFVAVRHGGGHTWSVGDGRFVAEADAVHDGWQPALAGIEGEPVPVVLTPRGHRQRV